MIHHLSALTVCLPIYIGKGGRGNCLCLPAGVFTSCLWCVRHRYRCLSYLDTWYSVTFEAYMTLLSFPELRIPLNRRIHSSLPPFVYTWSCCQGASCSVGSSPWGVGLKSWDVRFPPLRMTSLCWLHLVRQKLRFLLCIKILLKTLQSGLVCHTVLGWDGPFLCPIIPFSADFISIFFVRRQIQRRFWMRVGVRVWYST